MLAGPLHAEVLAIAAGLLAEQMADLLTFEAHIAALPRQLRLLRLKALWKVDGGMALVNIGTNVYLFLFLLFLLLLLLIVTAFAVAESERLHWSDPAAVPVAVATRLIRLAQRGAAVSLLSQ